VFLTTTIWRFRQALAAHELAEALFEEINRQLDARGLVVREGTLIDATLLQASVKPPSAKEGTVSGRDLEAGWTQKNGNSHFGYKAQWRSIKARRSSAWRPDRVCSPSPRWTVSCLCGRTRSSAGGVAMPLSAAMRFSISR
jgi:IS5 family transposase